MTASVQVSNELKPGHPAITKVYCTEAGIGIFHCYIQIDERLKRPSNVGLLGGGGIGSERRTCLTTSLTARTTRRVA